MILRLGDARKTLGECKYNSASESLSIESYRHTLPTLRDPGIKVLHYPGVRPFLDEASDHHGAVGREVAAVDSKAPGDLADGNLADWFGSARSRRHSDQGRTGGVDRGDPPAARRP